MPNSRYSSKDSLENRESRKDKAMVTFRIVLSMDTMPRTVHLVGSWDGFCGRLPMDQDLRVGRGVWKGMIAEKGGLEMGHNYTYYFLLDSKTSIPDPGSTPDQTTIDPTNGRLVSMLYVPLELPPSPEKPPSPPPHLFLPTQPSATWAAPLDEKEKTISPVSVIGSSVFAGSSGEGKLFEEPRKVPEHPTIQSPTEAEATAKDPGSFWGKTRRRSSSRRISIFQFGTNKDVPLPTEEIVIKKRKWTLAKKASGIFRGRSKVRTEEDEGKASGVVGRSGKSPAVVGIEGTEVELPPIKQVHPPASMKNSNKISDIVGYLRETSSEMSINRSGGLQPQPARAYYHSPVTLNRSHSTSRQPNQQQAQPEPPLQPQPERHLQPCLLSPLHTVFSEVDEVSSHATGNLILPSLYHSVESACSCHAPSTCSCSPNGSSAFSPDESCASDEADDGEDDDSFELETPIGGLGISARPYRGSKIRHSQQEKDSQNLVYPKYYNFDEITSGVPGGNRDIGRYAGDVIMGGANNRGCGLAVGGMKSLECLREEVAGELAWRAELADELGYLGGIVV